MIGKQCYTCVGNWSMYDGHTHSDHQEVRYTIGECSKSVEGECSQAGRLLRERTRSTEQFSKELFVETLKNEEPLSNLRAVKSTAVLIRACDTTVPRQI